MASFQIGWQQTNDAPFRGVAVELPETLDKAAAIQCKIPDVVSAVNHARGSTAFKNDLRFLSPRDHFMGLEKSNRQKGYLIDRGNLVPFNPHQLNVLPVYRVVLGLNPENIQCHLVKAGNVKIKQAPG